MRTDFRVFLLFCFAVACLVPLLSVAQPAYDDGIDYGYDTPLPPPPPSSGGTDTPGSDDPTIGTGQSSGSITPPQDPTTSTNIDSTSGVTSGLTTGLTPQQMVPLPDAYYYCARVPTITIVGRSNLDPYLYNDEYEWNAVWIALIARQNPGTGLLHATTSLFGSQNLGELLVRIKNLLAVDRVTCPNLCGGPEKFDRSIFIGYGEGCNANNRLTGTWAEFTYLYDAVDRVMYLTVNDPQHMTTSGRAVHAEFKCLCRRSGE